MSIPPKILIIPGNGNADINTDCWYSWARDEFQKLGFPVRAENMPDPEIAHMDIWLPHIKNELQADENTIIIGHSLGAVAAMRYLEHNKLLGAVLIGACYTDLGLESEKEAGYYTDPWQWESIKANTKWLIQFASTDDPYVMIDEARYIHKQTNSEYYEFTDRGHFGDELKPTREFPELVEAVRKKVYSGML